MSCTPSHQYQEQITELENRLTLAEQESKWYREDRDRIQSRVEELELRNGRLRKAVKEANPIIEAARDCSGGMHPPLWVGPLGVSLADAADDWAVVWGLQQCDQPKEAGKGMKERPRPEAIRQYEEGR